MPFLATSAAKSSYGILAHEKLQDFYNIPRGKNQRKTAKITLLARETKIY
jgi:hypothetical protein